MFAKLFLAALLAAALASAQGKKGSNNNNPDTMGTYRPQPRQTKFGLFTEKLKLNKEQKEEATATVAAAIEESAPVREDLDKSRVALASALIDGKTGDDLKKPADDYTAAAARMTAIEVKAFSKVYASLKPNQQSKAGQAFELLAEVLEQVGAGGERSGRGRGRQ